MSYQQQNAKVLLDLEALIENIGFGILDVSMQLNSKQIRAVSFSGKKKLKYGKSENKRALEDIAARLVSSISQKKTEDVIFTVKIRNGNVNESVWTSTLIKSYEANQRRENELEEKELTVE